MHEPTHLCAGHTCTKFELDRLHTFTVNVSNH